jgi:hypothetical protein
MSTAEQYRAFARECITWASNAKDVAHREILLDMATHWVHAAARLDHQNSQNDTLDSLVRQAKEKTGTAARTNGSG